jgi:putative PIN family toxin of toxin-antitoxin system
MYELIVSPLLLAELDRALAYPKLRRRIPIESGEALIDLLRRSATLVNDPEAGSAPISSRDPGDDYLLALAISERAALVTGDGDLLTIDADLPIYSPAAFIDLIEEP